MTDLSAPHPQDSHQNEYDYDVFISYSTCDQEWVRGELLSTLEKAGLKVCIDYRDFRPGAPILTEIRRSVKASKKILVAMTPDYIESEWTEFEVLLVQTIGPTNKDVRLIPLRKSPCNIPENLAIFIYVDFAEPNNLEYEWNRLLTALGKTPPVEPEEVQVPLQWGLIHPYGMPPNFTGRKTELQMLSDWLNGDEKHPLLVLRALGGFGKSALTWHWLTHEVNARQWQKVFWWSFYEASATFSNFLRVALNYITGIDCSQLPPQEQLRQLLIFLQQNQVLLVMDGFERELRAYSGMGAAYQGDELNDEGNQPSDRDCINPLADQFLRNLACLPQVKGKVLMSTRLYPRALELTGGQVLAGCREVELTQMQPGDAVDFFQRQGIRGNRSEIEQACRNYGFHPLSLRLLAGYIIDDFEMPGDIKAAANLDLSGDLVQRRNHVLARSYENLSTEVRQLLGQIACFRSPVAYKVLQAVSEVQDDASKQTMSTKEALKNLVNRGLVHQDRRMCDGQPNAMFDLHPIVRRYAYDRMARTARTHAHVQLRDYVAAVSEVDQVNTMEDLAPVIELYHHIVRTGQYKEAFELFHDRLEDPTYFQLGAYQLRIELLGALFPQGEDQPPQLNNEYAQSWTLNSLANSYGTSGQPQKAVPLFEQVTVIDERLDDKNNLAITLSNLAQSAQLSMGALQAAETNLRRSMALCQEIENEFHEAIAHVELGRLLAYRGAWSESEAELKHGLQSFEQQNHIQCQGLIWAARALAALLRIRADENQATETALEAAVRSLQFANETARTNYPIERDYVRAHWLLGASHRVNGDHRTQSNTHLNEALTRCRTINLVEFEADILLDLARLRAEEGQTDEALNLANEALLITERCGYVLQGADVQLFLAQQALEKGDLENVLTHAKKARELATCDGGDYTYKVAYDEAGALLQQLGSS